MKALEHEDARLKKIVATQLRDVWPYDFTRAAPRDGGALGILNAGDG